MDTTYILGRGAVKDTYNLLADGIVQVVRALAQLDGTRAEEWALRHGLEGSSVKGEAGIDWDNKKERQAFAEDSSRCWPGIGTGPSGPDFPR